MTPSIAPVEQPTNVPTALKPSLEQYILPNVLDPNAIVYPKAEPRQKDYTFGNHDYSNLFAQANRQDLNPKIGTEIKGLQLSQLTEDQAKELVLLLAERGVVFFRDQDLTPQQHRDLGIKLGKAETGSDPQLHLHPTLTGTQEIPELAEIKADATSQVVAGEAWHSDTSFEDRPTSFSILKINKAPTGGDTLWVKTTGVYDKISPPLQQFLEGRLAVHSTSVNPELAQAYAQAIKNRPGNGLVRRLPPPVAHPVIRTHPVTGFKSLNVSELFTRQIVGLNRLESDTLLKYLSDLVYRSVELQVRFKWQDNSVAIWDNRLTQHQAIWDYYPQVREGHRIAVYGEVPFFDVENSKSENKTLDSFSPAWSRGIISK